MRSRFSVLVLVPFLVLVGGACTFDLPHAQIASDAAECDLALTGAQVVDPELKTITRANLVIRQGRIVAVGEASKLFHCQQELDLHDAWLMPGLTDMHVHSWGNPSPNEEDDDEDLGTEAVAHLVLKAGVTALLDLGSSEAEILPLRDRLRDEAVPLHADLFAAGPVFVEAHRRLGKRADGHGPRLVSGPEDARHQVRELAVHQPDVIKIIYDHNGRAGSMSKETMQAIVDEARKIGMKTVVHIGTWRDAQDAIEAGASAVTHLYDHETIPSALAQLYVEKNVLSIPTMAVQCDFALQRARPALLENPLLKLLTGNELRAQYRDHRHYSSTARFTGEWQAADCVAHDFKSLKIMAANGVAIGAGSDSGNLGVFEGYSVHRELALMVAAGMDTWAALASATTVPGTFLGHRFGVHVGDEASLVTVSANPVAHIENTQTITHVIVHGQVAF